MTINQAHKIHCLGIGGIGVSALAQLFAAQGKEVTGYDDAFPSLRDGALSLSDEIDLVVYSDAVPENHPQRVLAREQGIPEMSYAQALGEVSRDYKTIVVSGTHGKSTTTAMLGLIMEQAGLDPLVIVGTKVPGWPLGNLRLPKEQGTMNKEQLLIVEGDDYRDHFLELQPQAVVVTTIEYDHPDFFKDLDDTVESFKELVEKVSEQGIVVLNKDDQGCQQLFTQLQHTNILENVSMLQYGRVSELFEKMSLQVPGDFNKYNALAAATCARELGVTDEVIKKALGEFKGVWRRFEVVGTISCHPERPQGAEGSHTLPNAENEIFPLAVLGRNDKVFVISDYGHHPTAIRETMKGARQAYPGRRLVLVYQPHQHSRTKRLFNDFVEVLQDAADVVIVSEIYAVKGRLEDRDVSSSQLVESISRLRNREINNVLYGGSLEETKRVVLEKVQSNDVVIFMGAGDIDNLARELCVENKK